ncbi:MAG: cysteine--tRNA ligase [bacterium]|nr:cysteine--tRNA ligase [bacterium]
MKLYNTLTKQKEEFVPIHDKKVNMFACGPTVYDFLHIGNGRTAITMDTLARLLKYLGYDVNYIMNITDIDDKIIKRAQESNTSWKDLTQKFEKQYLLDMKGLNVHADKYVRATDHIKDIIKQVLTLLDKDFAYTIDNDGIYFEISKFKDYGKLSGRSDIKKDDAQSRVDHSDHKRGWNDFALWKFKRGDDPSWEAPFGEGRPGWHIEDTAITEHYFGPQYDIHGGGSDLIFPHHEAELTQMEAASGKIPFVKYWVHGGLLYTSGERMGKSNNNFLTIHEVLEKYDANTVRLFMLSAHYRSQLNFSEEQLEASQHRVNRWLSIADLLHQELNSKDNPDFDLKVVEIVTALEDDLNTPKAIAVVEEIFSNVETISTNQLKKLLEILDEILGIKLDSKDIDKEQKDLLAKRQIAKESKNYELSDEIRSELKKLGIEIKDRGDGQIWSRIR